MWRGNLCRFISQPYKRRKRKTRTRERKIMGEEEKIVVPADKPEISKKVKVDLEVDTSVKDLSPNPYAKLIHMARAVDSWRIFPRLFLQMCNMVYELTAPTMEQSGLISIVVGVASKFGLYTGSSKKNK